MFIYFNGLFNKLVLFMMNDWKRPVCRHHFLDGGPGLGIYEVCNCIMQGTY